MQTLIKLFIQNLKKPKRYIHVVYIVYVTAVLYIYIASDSNYTTMYAFFCQPVNPSFFGNFCVSMKGNFQKITVFQKIILKSSYSFKNFKNQYFQKFFTHVRNFLTSIFICNFIIVRNFLHVLWLKFKFFLIWAIFLKHIVQNSYLPN